MLLSSQNHYWHHPVLSCTRPRYFWVYSSITWKASKICRLIWTYFRTYGKNISIAKAALLYRRICVHCCVLWLVYLYLSVILPYQSYTIGLKMWLPLLVIFYSYISNSTNETADKLVKFHGLCFCFCFYFFFTLFLSFSSRLMHTFNKWRIRKEKKERKEMGMYI